MALVCACVVCMWCVVCVVEGLIIAAELVSCLKRSLALMWCVCVSK